MKFREFSAMQNIPKSTESSPTFSYRLPVPVLKYPGDQQFLAKNLRFETKASIPARSRPLSLFRELLHANTIRLSISEVGIFKRRRICAIAQNCAEGFWVKSYLDNQKENVSVIKLDYIVQGTVEGTWHRVLGAGYRIQVTGL